MAEFACYADGVIVGSAFVRAALKRPSDAKASQAAGTLAAELADSVQWPLKRVSRVRLEPRLGM